MFKFSEKKNREDVIALRWPKACLSCGSEKVQNSESRYAIVGKFHVVKQTQVLVKLPGFFYMCSDCSTIIRTVLENIEGREDKFTKLAETLMEAPWNQIIELEKDGYIRIPDGRFKEKLVENNPDVCIKAKSNPMDILRRTITK
ncbi:MAG: hypothetical protein ACW98Y_18580 [Candidatus Thorarchaeota archaeon]|jgi:hypothetical protein